MKQKVLDFYKFHGAGNDFIMINSFDTEVVLQTEEIAFLCNPHLGIGADGLIFIVKDKEVDFRMIYYNSDGYEGSMCGNGGRSTAAFAFLLGFIEKNCSFRAFDGLHEATIIHHHERDFDVEISMKDVVEYDLTEKRLIVNTGSPHYIERSDNLSSVDVVAKGREIRNLPDFEPNGINVNFFQSEGNKIHLRTYERGVEDETLSCGTGVTAAAIAASLWYGKNESVIYTKGGTLSVKLTKTDSGFTGIKLRGPVTYVFNGQITIGR